MSSQHPKRWTIAVRVLLIVMLAGLSSWPGAGELVSPALANNHDVGNFEMDGNKPDDGTPGDDWDTPGINEQIIVDPEPPDTRFSGGSKAFSPGTWSCDAASNPPKSNILQIGTFLRDQNGEQFLHAYWLREATNGSTHINFEFNQSLSANPSCPEVPQRSNGDLVVGYDATNGGSTIIIRLFEWQFDPGSTTTGVFNLVADNNSLNFRAAVSPSGDFGEVVINMSASPIGRLDCGEFGLLWSSSRASDEINSEMKDRTPTEPFKGGCPDLQLEKAVRNVTTNGSFGPSATASPGDTLEYRLELTNVGDAPATEVKVSDTIKQRTTFVSCDPAVPGAAPCETTQNQGKVTAVSWNLGTVGGGGMETMRFRVVLDEVFPEGQTDITNTATGTSKEEPQFNSNQTTVTVTAAPNFDQVDKEADADHVTVGDTTTYKITVFNNGNADGIAHVVDNYNQAHVDVSNISDGGQNNGDTITWNILVPAGSSRTVSYEATFKGPFTGESGTGGCGPGEFPVINTVTVGEATDSETVCVSAAPAFEVTKTADPKSVNAGESATYTIEVTNVGDAAGSTPVVDDYDQAHVTVSNISGGGVDNGDTITWDSGTLNPGQSVSFSYVGTFGGTFTEGEGTQGCQVGQFPVINNVTVTGDSAQEVVCITAEPAFSVEKTASSTTANIGDDITYTIEVTNVGTNIGSTSVVDDYDQAHVTVSNISGGGVDNGDTITWDSGDLAPGEKVTFTYQGQIKGPFSGTTAPCAQANHYPVVNTVIVDGDSDTEIVCVLAEPDLSLAKSRIMTPGSTAKVTLGDEITYELTASNGATAGAAASNVVVSDQIPAFTTFVSCTGNCSGVAPGNTGTVTWNIGTLTPGQSQTVQLVVKVTENEDDFGPISDLGCVICNDGVIDSAQTAPEPSNQVCVDVLSPPSAQDAVARGDALGASVYVADISDPTMPEVLVNQQIAPVESEATEANPNAGQAYGTPAVNVALLPGGDELALGAEAIHTISTSIVEREYAEQTSIASVHGSKLLQNVLPQDIEDLLQSQLGLDAGAVLDASIIRAVAHSRSDANSGEADTNGSTIAMLKIFGQEVANADQPQTIDLDATLAEILIAAGLTEAEAHDLAQDLLGANSFVALNQRSDVDQADPSQLATADATMLHLHIDKLAPASLRVDIVVSQAHAESSFVPDLECPGLIAARGFIAELIALGQPTLTVGESEIPPTGGTADFHANSLAVGDSPTLGLVLMQSGEATTHADGAMNLNDSQANAFARVEQMCLLRSALEDNICVVAADVVEAHSHSEAASGSASSNDVTGAGQTQILNLHINGTPYPINANDTGVNVDITDPVTGQSIGFLKINSQKATCGGQDVAPTRPANCAAGIESASRNVYMLHLVITNTFLAETLGQALDIENPAPLLEIRAIGAETKAEF